MVEETVATTSRATVVPEATPWGPPATLWPVEQRLWAILAGAGSDSVNDVLLRPLVARPLHPLISHVPVPPMDPALLNMIDSAAPVAELIETLSLVAELSLRS